LGRGRGEAVDGFFERGTPAFGLRRGLVVAILSALILLIFSIINITREEVLKHG
jgi:hypothetical protein